MISKKNILVVDDDPANIKIINEYLIEASTNYEVLNATSASLALTIAVSLKPDLIITDWEMPNMNGIELVKALKKNPVTALIPVIMASGVMTNATDLDEALSAGAIDYVRKPLDRIELKARVRTCLLLAETMEAIRKQEQQLQEKRTTELKAELKYRERELASNISLLIHAGTVRDRLLEEMQGLRTFLNNEGKNKLYTLTTVLQQELKEELWPSFEQKFNELNFEFFDLLEKKCSDITRNEKTLCAYLRMNYNAGDIARITGKSQNSIHVAFARLRSKLQLPDNKELKSHLQELSVS